MEFGKKRLKGFTLIELLVVISIIALLLSILVPTLSRVKGLARVVVCKSTLRNLGTALAIYHSTYNNHGIEQRVDESSKTGDYWLTLLAPYLGESHHGTKDVSNDQEVMGIVDCPSTKPPLLPAPEPCWGTAVNRWRYAFAGRENYFAEGSYGLNFWVGGWELKTWVPKTLHSYSYRKQVPGRSDIPSFSDSNWIDFIPQNADRPPVDISIGGLYGANLGLQRICIDRHDMKVNLTFLDNHVESVPLNKLWSFKWHRDFEIVHDMELQ